MQDQLSGRSLVSPRSQIASGRALLRVVSALPVVLALGMLATGCRSFYTVDIHTPAGLRVVEVGELVRVTTHGGERREFKVTDVAPGRIVGADTSFTSQQVQTLERDEASGAKTVALETGLWAVLTVATAVLFAAAFTVSVFG